MLNTDAHPVIAGDTPVVSEPSSNSTAVISPGVSRYARRTPEFRDALTASAARVIVRLRAAAALALSFHPEARGRARFEFRNMSPAYDGLREDEFDEARFAAWREGQISYPMVDAWMRAMLMSFASYHLWLHWRPTALHLAQLFLDHEPGIRYSQSQMHCPSTCSAGAVASSAKTIRRLSSTTRALTGRRDLGCRP